LPCPPVRRSPSGGPRRRLSLPACGRSPLLDAVSATENASAGLRRQQLDWCPHVEVSEHRTESNSQCGERYHQNHADADLETRGLFDPTFSRHAAFSRRRSADRYLDCPSLENREEAHQRSPNVSEPASKGTFRPVPMLDARRRTTRRALTPLAVTTLPRLAKSTRGTTMSEETSASTEARSSGFLFLFRQRMLGDLQCNSGFRVRAKTRAPE
jgi:hypothetical protein